MRRIGAAVLLLAASVVDTGTASAADPIYLDPSQPVPRRVADMLGRMSLDEKVGQMTQAERNAVSAADITNFRIGSLLSGGGSAPPPNNATSWANMYDGFQRAATATPLKIPMIYGVDAVHGVGPAIRTQTSLAAALAVASLVQCRERRAAGRVAPTRSPMW
jgi:beta-glucosidase